MIDKTPIPSLDLNSTEAKIQMNNFWKYLDDLAESDPEEYKKFISAQMKKGIQTFAPKNQNESNTSQYIKTKQEFANIQTYKCLRFKPIQIIKEEENSSNKENDSIIYKEKATATASDISEIPNIQFGPEFQSDAFSSKVIQNRKIYLNILHADDYYGPTDDQGNFLKGEQLLNENNWRYIPTEFRYCGKKNSFSGSRCDFYDVIINSTVINKIQKDKSLYKTILGYIVRKFIIFLNDKIVLYTNSVKIVEEKKYKNVNHKPETFKSKLGERSLAVEKIHQQQKQKQQQQQQRVKDDKIIIPGTNLSESRNELYKEEKTITPVDKIIENNINSDNSKEKENAANSKPVVIEEVGAVNKQIIPIKKKILSQTQMEVKFFFDEFEYLKGLKEIDLQIGENGIIIHLDNPHYIIDKNYEPVEMKFNFKVDPDKCSAKYSKKEKVLTVIIERII